MLTCAGYCVDIAVTGTDALNALQRTHYAAATGRQPGRRSASGARGILTSLLRFAIAPLCLGRLASV